MDGRRISSAFSFKGGWLPGEWSPYLGWQLFALPFVYASARQHQQMSV